MIEHHALYKLLDSHMAPYGSFLSSKVFSNHSSCSAGKNISEHVLSLWCSTATSMFCRCGRGPNCGLHNPNGFLSMRKRPKRYSVDVSLCSGDVEEVQKVFCRCFSMFCRCGRRLNGVLSMFLDVLSIRKWPKWCSVDVSRCSVDAEGA